MKRITFFVVMVMALLVTSCGSMQMKESTQKPVLKASADKALLVIFRTTVYGGSKVIDNFIDQKFIGQTRSKSYLVAQVDPGVHYVVSDAENKGSAKINFEAGKTYFLTQLIFPGFMSARTGFKADKIAYFHEQLPEMTYYVLNIEGEVPALSDEDYKEVVADYERESKEDPERFKDIVEIEGLNL